MKVPFQQILHQKWSEIIHSLRQNNEKFEFAKQLIGIMSMYILFEHLKGFLNPPKHRITPTSLQALIGNFTLCPVSKFKIYAIKWWSNKLHFQLEQPKQLVNQELSENTIPHVHAMFAINSYI